jgi:hypothetical protein
MSNTVFQNIDFGFRRGSHDGLMNTSIENGTFNVCKDTGELYIDIDGERIPTNDIIIYNSEAEIRALLTPAKKIYYARDTYNLLTFETSDLQWKIVGGEDVKFSHSAEKDSLGNIISDHYQSKAEAQSNIDTVNASINDLRAIVSNIISFEISVVESLPEEGKDHIIYFVHQDGSDDEDTQYDEYIWLSDPGYFEKIGITTSDLGNYYNKTEVDSQISSLNSTISNNQTLNDQKFTNVNSEIETLRSNINNSGSDIEYINSALAALNETYYNKTEVDAMFESFKSSIGVTQTESGDTVVDYGSMDDE